MKLSLMHYVKLQVLFLGIPLADVAQAQTVLDRVTAAPAVVKSLSLTTTQPGRIVAYEETPLVSKLSGYVETVLVDIGSKVRKGDVLVKLSVPEMADELLQRRALIMQAEAEVGQAKASVEAAEASVASAEAGIQEAAAGKGRAMAEFDRYKAESGRIQQLAKTGSVTNKLADETLSQFKAAEASLTEVEARVHTAQAMKKQATAMLAKSRADQVASEAKLGVAQANLKYLETMHAYREIKAPYDGVITERHIATGDFVHPVSSQTHPLLTMARIDLVRLRVDVPEMEAGAVDADPQSGDDATITIQSLPRPPMQAKLQRSSWSLGATNRSLRTEIDLQNSDQSLRPGMYASVTIVLDKRTDVLVLPITAILKKGAEPYVCVVKDGKISHRPIQLGLRSGSEIEIVSGITKEDAVVTIRGDGLADGQSVAIITVPPK